MKATINGITFQIENEQDLALILKTKTATQEKTHQELYNEAETQPNQITTPSLRRRKGRKTTWTTEEIQYLKENFKVGTKKDRITKKDRKQNRKTAKLLKKTMVACRLYYRRHIQKYPPLQYTNLEPEDKTLKAWTNSDTKILTKEWMNHHNSRGYTSKQLRQHNEALADKLGRTYHACLIKYSKLKINPPSNTKTCAICHQPMPSRRKVTCVNKKCIITYKRKINRKYYEERLDKEKTKETPLITLDESISQKRLNWLNKRRKYLIKYERKSYEEATNQASLEWKWKNTNNYAKNEEVPKFQNNNTNLDFSEPEILLLKSLAQGTIKTISQYTYRSILTSSNATDWENFTNKILQNNKNILIAFGKKGKYIIENGFINYKGDVN